MQVTRISVLTGIRRTMDLPVTGLQMRLFERRSGLVQEIFPDLTADQQDFIMSGITAEEWAAHSSD